MATWHENYVDTVVEAKDALHLPVLCDLVRKRLQLLRRQALKTAALLLLLQVGALVSPASRNLPMRNVAGLRPITVYDSAALPRPIRSCILLVLYPLI